MVSAAGLALAAVVLWATHLAPVAVALAILGLAWTAATLAAVAHLDRRLVRHAAEQDRQICRRLERLETGLGKRLAQAERAVGEQAAHMARDAKEHRRVVADSLRTALARQDATLTSTSDSLERSLADTATQMRDTLNQDQRKARERLAA